KRYDESEESYNKAIEIMPDFPIPYYLKGRMNFGAMRYEKALVTFTQYLNLKKTFPEQKQEVEFLVKCCEFAKEAMKNPVPFNPENLGSNVNSEDDDYFPGLTVDEEVLYFTRRLGINEDFYSSKLGEGNRWQKARNLGSPVNTDQNEGFISVTTDGQFIFFTACMRPDGKGRCDLYFSKLTGDLWSKPTNLPEPVNTAHWESQPSVSF